MVRLKAAFELLKGINCTVLADIGCDHGILSKLVLENGLAESVICSDISPSSLKKAEKLLNGYSNVSFLVSDGFNYLPKTIDTAVIMGMGGHEIERIISGNNNHADKLVLSPQTRPEVVRGRLYSLGYEIAKDIVVFENGKYYDIMLALKAEGRVIQPLSDIQLQFGVFYKIPSKALLKKLLKIEARLKEFKPTSQNLIKLEMINEVKKWQQ